MKIVESLETAISATHRWANMNQKGKRRREKRRKNEGKVIVLTPSGVSGERKLLISEQRGARNPIDNSISWGSYLVLCQRYR
ncbi:MAG: hypothetical protein QXU60_06925 [Sulfolobales archaeon]